MVKVYEVGEVYFDRKTPVPSYDEYKRLQEQLNECEEALVEAYDDCYDEGFEPDLAKDYLKKYGIK